MDKDIAEIIEILHTILLRMATRDDLVELRIELKAEIAGLRVEMQQEFALIRAEMRDIRKRLDVIEAELKNHAGYAKEIDLLAEPVRAIEKHLGIQQRIAA